jgi:hypothetical protein
MTNRPPRLVSSENYFGGHFGVCPYCHKFDGWANAGKSHRMYCKEHRVSWYVGANLFGDWRDQTEEEQRRIWAEIGLDDFRHVEPFFPPEDQEEEEAAYDEARDIGENSEMFVLKVFGCARIWPPLNPDPNCEHCGGTGYKRIRDDEAQIDVTGRCHCNVERLNPDKA